MKIFNIPIEPYEERYTEQYYRWFPMAYRALGVEFKTIDGEVLTSKVEIGSVLDVYGTHYYKYSQLMKLVEMIRNNEVQDDDILFFHDLWFPGIEGIQYIRNMTGKKFKITGILHAGTWDESDFTFKTGMRPWAKDVEKGWLNFFDHIMIATQFHKDLIIKGNEGIDPNKLIVTGIPFEQEEINRSEGITKENIVVFPHRLNEEKRPDLFDRLAGDLQAAFPDWKFLKTKDITNTKEEYYKLLGKSKIAVSFAEQETFGYAMLEAMANGCQCLVPNKLSYATMSNYQEENKFDTYLDCLEKVRRAIETDIRHSGNLEQYRTINVVKRFLKAINKI